MAYELTVALDVADEEMYARYRTEIAPLLQAAGGTFRYDFVVARTLRGELTTEVNRLFMLQFPDREARQRFFSDPRYLEIRARLFNNAVKSSAVIAEYSI